MLHVTGLLQVGGRDMKSYSQCPIKHCRPVHTCSLCSQAKDNTVLYGTISWSRDVPWPR